MNICAKDLAPRRTDMTITAKSLNGWNPGQFELDRGPGGTGQAFNWSVYTILVARSSYRPERLVGIAVLILEG